MPFPLTYLSKNSPILYRWRDELQEVCAKNKKEQHERLFAMFESSIIWSKNNSVEDIRDQ